MIMEWMPNYAQVFRAIPPLFDQESGIGSFKLDAHNVSDKTNHSHSDPRPLEAETLPMPTGVEVHMCVPGGEEGVLAFTCALEDCLKEYGIEFGEERGRSGGGLLYHKLFSTY